MPELSRKCQRRDTAVTLLVLDTGLDNAWLTLLLNHMLRV